VDRYKDLLETLMKDPAQSFWLKNAIRELEFRDPVDCLSDAQALHHVQTLRLNEAHHEAVRRMVANKNTPEQMVVST